MPSVVLANAAYEDIVNILEGIHEKFGEIAFRSTVAPGDHRYRKVA
jgi:hypothetical protein